jgi:hypothetical protein
MQASQLPDGIYFLEIGCIGIWDQLSLLCTERPFWFCCSDDQECLTLLIEEPPSWARRTWRRGAKSTESWILHAVTPSFPSRKENKSFPAWRMQSRRTRKSRAKYFYSACLVVFGRGRCCSILGRRKNIMRAERFNRCSKLEHREQLLV